MILFRIMIAALAASLSTQAIAKSQAAAAGWHTYANDKYHFRLNYPRQWITGTPLRATDLADVVLYVQDAGIKEGVEVGGAIPPQLLVRVADKSRYRHLNISAALNVPPDEITMEQKKINLSQQATDLYRYTSSAPEGAITITELIELTHGDKVYLLQYSYTLAGCANISAPFREECSAGNRKLASDSENIFAQVLASLKFN